MVITRERIFLSDPPLGGMGLLGHAGLWVADPVGGYQPQILGLILRLIIKVYSKIDRNYSGNCSLALLVLCCAKERMPE
jgi:hypothetical protein